MNRKPAHTGRITAQTGCLHEAALRELLAALRASACEEGGRDLEHPIFVWFYKRVDMSPWFSDTQHDLYDALVAAERAVGEVQTGG